MTSIKPSALLKGEGLPDYDKITPIEITENIPKLIKELNENHNELKNKIEINQKNYEKLIDEAASEIQSFVEKANLENLS